MMVAVFNVIKPILAAVLLAVGAAEMENDVPGAGAQKKARATQFLFEAIDPWAPDWANPVIKGAAGFLIDSMVAFANRTGFFAQLGALPSE